MVWLGGLVRLTLLSGRVLRAGEHEAIDRFTDNLRVVGRSPWPRTAMAGVIAFGIWMVVDNFGQTWIWLALVLFGAALSSAPAIRAARQSAPSARGGLR